MLGSDIKSVAFIIFEFTLVLNQKNHFLYFTKLLSSGVSVGTSSLRVSPRVMVLKTIYMLPSKFLLVPSALIGTLNSCNELSTWSHYIDIP